MLGKIRGCERDPAFPAPRLGLADPGRIRRQGDPGTSGIRVAYPVMPIPGDQFSFRKEPRQRSCEGGMARRIKRAVGERKANNERRAIGGLSFGKQPAQATRAATRQNARLYPFDLEPELQGVAAVTERNRLALPCRKRW